MDQSSILLSYISQQQNSSCFVVAVANAAINAGLPVPDLSVACIIGKCNTGCVIEHQAVIDYINVPLKGCLDVDMILRTGGIVTILHPIFNLHSVFVYPASTGYVLAVNSWLGPNVMVISQREFEPFIWKRKGESVRSWWLDKLVVDCDTNSAVGV